MTVYLVGFFVKKSNPTILVGESTNRMFVILYFGSEIAM